MVVVVAEESFGSHQILVLKVKGYGISWFKVSFKDLGTHHWTGIYLSSTATLDQDPCS